MDQVLALSNQLGFAVQARMRLHSIWRYRAYSAATLATAIAVACGSAEENDEDDTSAAGSTSQAAAGSNADTMNVGVGATGGSGSSAASGGEGGVDDTPAAVPESAAGLELVQIYSGTYDVQATAGTHSRGTVTISADGATFDFDAGSTFSIEGGNVYNRIVNFPEEPRVQIEIPGDPQQRLRIFVDPSDPSVAIRFTYDDDATDEAQAVEVDVVNASRASNSGDDNMTDMESGNSTPFMGAGIAATVGGTSLLYAQNVFTFVNGEGNRSLTANGDNSTFFTLQFPEEVGTHECFGANADGMDGQRTLLTFSTNDGQPLVFATDENIADSECTIVVTSVTDRLEGTFTATVRGDGDAVSVTDGVFGADL